MTAGRIAELVGHALAWLFTLFLGWRIWAAWTAGNEELCALWFIAACALSLWGRASQLLRLAKDRAKP